MAAVQQLQAQRYAAASPLPLDRVVSAAAAEAEQVDRDAVFPVAALAAMRQERLLSGLIPMAMGGGGLSVSQIAAQCLAIGGACGSAATVFAMHQIQVACLVAHGGADPWQSELLYRIADQQLLIGSVTSETGVGGAFRSSLCALEWDRDQFNLEKPAPVVSYGSHADGLLVTARRSADAEGHDQVLVAFLGEDYALERRGHWDGMGLRGTDSAPFSFTGRGRRRQILRDPFSQIASRTMLPLSHLLWSAVWLGIAGDVVRRTRRLLRKGMRGSDGTIPAGAGRLVDAVALLSTLRARTRELLHKYDSQFIDGSFGDQFSDAASVNMLKLSVSEGCLAVARTCLLACGFQGYGNDGPFSLSRHLRDLEAGPLMVNNDRIRDNTAQLLLAQLPELGL